MKCPNCGCNTDVLLIDCRLPLGSHERETVRYCAECRPEAVHEYANCLPQIIRKANIPESEKEAAFRARRFAPDRLASYPVKERLFDLGLTAGIPTHDMTIDKYSIGFQATS